MFTHAHASGLWNAPPEAWRDLELDLSNRASVITFTETTVRKPTGSRKGWDAYHGGRESGANECTICWDGADWTPEGEGFARPVSRTRYALGNGKIRPNVHVTAQLLHEDATGRLICFGVLHGPSAIEGKGGLVAARRAIAALEVFAGWRKLKREIRREHPGVEFVLSGDWNLDIFKAWVRAFLKARVGMRNAWHKLPDRGSHGDRLIDGVRHSRQLRTHGSVLLKRRPPFDHTPLVTEFR